MKIVFFNIYNKMDSLLFNYKYLNFYPVIESANLDIIYKYAYYRVFNVS